MVDKLLPTEAQEQVKLVTALNKLQILHYAVPNGGKRDYYEACKLRRSGVQAGVPDLCIPIARGPYHGLYIELKRQKGGNISDAQRWWIKRLTEEGYKAEIVRGYDLAIELVLNYLKL